MDLLYRRLATSGNGNNTDNTGTTASNSHGRFRYFHISFPALWFLKRRVGCGGSEPALPRAGSPLRLINPLGVGLGVQCSELALQWLEEELA